MAAGGADIGELLRQLGREAIEAEAETAGLSPRAGRLRCPWAGCEHKGAARERDAAVFAGQGGRYRVHCFACNETGDLVDLLRRTRALSTEEALAHVRGVQVPTRRPELRVVATPSPAEHPDKMQPSEVQRLWNSLAVDDAAGRAYLAKRHLEDAVDAGLVRFATGSKDKRVSGRARQGYVLAALTRDVVGQPRGVQLRLARGALNSGEATIVSVKGSVTSTAFFGEPGLIETAHLVGVAEGFADTLALRLWAGEAAVVVGGAGKGSLPRLAQELEAAGVDIAGKLFALFPQNDDPRQLRSTSRTEFVRLAQLLQARGARVVWVGTPQEHGDIADWLQAKPDTEWPPAELTRAFGSTPGDEAAPAWVLPDGLAVAVPAQVRTERFAQDFTTLCALLDDAAHREAVMGQGELSWCEMTTRVRWGGRELAEHDLSTIRLGLERVARSTDGKPLKFPERDIEKALTLLARRRPVHAVRAWLTALQWDGQPRLESDLPALLGHEAGGFEGRLLRRWLVSAVARAVEPGCKVDTVLILTGRQGGRKSTFFETLGGPWFTDSRVEVGDKDGMLVMRAAWIIEWAELDAMRRSRSAEATKAFLSARIDLFRHPYGRELARAPRHCVLVGTANEEDIFTDATGNRRFWPVTVRVPRIDLAWLRQHRELLWAEAVAIYRAGVACPSCLAAGERCGEHRWWLTADEEVQLEERNKHFEAAQHPWTDVIRDWLAENPFMDRVTVAQVLKVALDQDVADFRALDGKQVGQCLQSLGWASRRVYEDRAWRRMWFRPEAAP